MLIDKSGYLKICDYGLSKFLERGERTNTYLGTLAYLAPEQVLSKYYDHGIDLWSTGISVYEMFHGVTPFEPTVTVDDAKWKQETTANICNLSLNFPDSVSSLHSS
jgi:serine/threonine protein kinase